MPPGYPLPWEVKLCYRFMISFYKLSFNDGFDLKKPRTHGTGENQGTGPNADADHQQFQNQGPVFHPLSAGEQPRQSRNGGITQ